MEASDPDELADAAGYLRAMAFHEASHAVVAWSLGLSVGDVYICGIGEGNGGTQIGGAENLSFINRIAVCFAGIEAADVFSAPQPSWAGNGDRVMAFELLLGMPDEHAKWLWTRGTTRARELLIENASKVTRLAERLIEVQRIDITEFIQLVSL